MSRYLFIALDQRRKLMFLRSKGKLLHRKFRNAHQVLVYNLGDFYVEVWYDAVDYTVENLIIHKDRSLLCYNFNLENRQVA